MWSTTDDVDDDDDITRSAKVTREIRANNGGGVSREGGGGAASVRRSPRPLRKTRNLESVRARTELLVSLKLLEDEERETLLNE